MKRDGALAECGLDDMRGDETLSHAVSAGAYPLSAAGSGRQVTVARLSGGKALGAKLSALGVIPGNGITVLCNAGGAMIVEVKGSRLSLGQGLARKIYVKDQLRG